MFERIKCQLMTRHYSKQKELTEEMQGAFCPKIRKKLKKNVEFANMCFAMPSGQGVFQVQYRDYQNIVDINAQTCDCRRWQLTGIPCCHAVACLRHERIRPESVLPACYSVETFYKAYGFNIWPCKEKAEWDKVGGPEVLPPVYVKKVGRPPKSRKKQPHELQGRNGPKLTKHGVTMHCKFCSDADHNTNGCKLKKMGFTTEEAKKLVANTRAQLEKEAEESAQQAAAVQEQTVHQTSAQEELLGRNEPINQELRPGDAEVYMTQGSTTLLNDMLSQETQSSMLSQPTGPLPDSGFILTNQPIPRSVPLTTCTKQGKAAATKKRKPPTRKDARSGKGRSKACAAQQEEPNSAEDDVHQEM